ncbi:MAG TPA: galactokinase [Vicinamibacterales bacterium]|nr:galactokinase [Vicinamibacterales bacterium]
MITSLSVATAPSASLQDRFRAAFGGDPFVYRAPGRVNLIGEHTDYNDGLVMPAALALSCRAAAARRDDGLLVVESANLHERVEIDLTQPIQPRGHWSDYVAGVASMLVAEGCPLAGATLLIDSEVPIGAGLSSSAALQVSVALALLDLTAFTMARTAIARLCQRAEQEFAGAAVGIMDQFVACHGRQGSALVLDCRSLEARHIPLAPGIRLVAANTRVRHSIAAGEYNRRRAECGEAVVRLAALYPHVRSLRDVTIEQIDHARGALPDVLFRRARHVVTENGRVEAAARALGRADLASLGPLMAASHRSLRDDYEVSCPELDAMVEIATGLPGVIGTRMTGGGFGGCTVTLVEEAAVGELLQRLPPLYAARTRLDPEVYVAASADGAGREG